MMNLSGMGAAGEHLQGILAGLQGPEGIRFSYIENDGFCIKNGGFCIKNGVFCIKIGGFCIKNDGFFIQDDGFCIKNGGFCIKNDEFRKAPSHNELAALYRCIHPPFHYIIFSFDFL